MARLRSAAAPPAPVQGMSSRRKLKRACYECKKPLAVDDGPLCAACLPIWLTGQRGARKP